MVHRPKTRIKYGLQTTDYRLGLKRWLEGLKTRRRFMTKEKTYNK